MVDVVGAIPIHVKLEDPPGVVTASILLVLVLLVFIAWGRFGPFAL